MPSAPSRWPAPPPRFDTPCKHPPAPASKPSGTHLTARNRSRRPLFKVRWIKQPAHRRHAVDWKAGLPAVFTNQRFVGSPVNAVHLVVGDEAVDPPNLGAQLPER